MLAPSENCINSIAHSKWLVHFTDVLNTDASGNINPQFLEYITSALPRLEDVTLRELSDDFKLPVYINLIKNPSIRLLFTRLRIDINVLSTSRGSKNEKTSVLYAMSKQRMYLILYYDALNLQQNETGSCPMPQYICQITNWALMHQN